MLSHRHAIDPRDEMVLDAARECVLAVGVRRTTAADIARRAGISRMTLYRRFPDVASVVQALMTRQFGGLLLQARDEAAGLPTARKRVAATMVRLLELLDGDPVLRRILDVDPELMLPYIVERPGAFQRAGIEALAAELREGMRDGSVRLGDAAVMAATVELAGRAHVLAAGAHERAVSAEVARQELGRMVDCYLAP
ncbi:MAG TPA: helix-turn-helix domain-containing protein [Baekduia sp.]|nr:helix-turn-helix domain-containing protein [Baekduia sp.]